MENTENQVIDEAITQIATRCLLVNLRCRHWTGKATDVRVAAGVEQRESAATGSTRVTKNLIDMAYINDIRKEAGAARRLINQFTVPWSSAGGRIAPAEKIPEFLMEMGVINEKFDKAVKRLCKDYPVLIRKAQLTLGTMYDPSVYPDAGTLESRFSLDVAISEVPTNTDFRFQIPDEVKDELKYKLRQSIDDSVTDVRDDLIKRCLAPLQALEKKLRTEDIKRFSESLVSNIVDTAEQVDQLNMFGNKEVTIAVRTPVSYTHLTLPTICSV